MVSKQATPLIFLIEQERNQLIQPFFRLQLDRNNFLAHARPKSKPKFREQPFSLPISALESELQFVRCPTLRHTIRRIVCDGLVNQATIYD
jgi:hypothetical protein